MAVNKTTHTGKHRILIVDDHPIFRQGLAQLINQEKDLCVCGEAEDYQAAMKAVAMLKPAGERACQTGCQEGGYGSGL